LRAPFAPLLLLLSTACVSTSTFAQQLPGFPTLLRGTPVTLQLDETINSANARVGQRVTFEVTSDVMLQDRVIIPAGSAALGTVAQVLHHSRVPKLGHSTSRLDVDIDTVRLPSGQIVMLSVTADVEDNGRGTTSDSIATSLVPIPATSHLLSAHRKDIVIPEGTVLQAYVRRDTVIVQQTASVSN
jgi:hypothetical protein